MEHILKYFPRLDPEQRQRMAALDGLYREWNAKINVISRRDIDNLYERHVLHSLAIAQAVTFRPGTRVMDLGTGGGFPGIPLAILFPQATFHLVDSVGKKVRVCREVASALGLDNVTTQWCRAEEVREKFQFIVSRAVMTLPDLVRLSRRLVAREQMNALPNGLLCLKGGELGAELGALGRGAEVTALSDYFGEEFFRTKKLVYVPL